jgi:hypothetical protein
MKRLFILVLLAPLPGCMGFEGSYYQDYIQEESTAPSCGCQSSAGGMSTSGVMPTVSQLPSITQPPTGQTREPELAPVK